MDSTKVGWSGMKLTPRERDILSTLRQGREVAPNRSDQTVARLLELALVRDCGPTLQMTADGVRALGVD